MTIRSFSGTHAYRSECVRLAVALDWLGQLPDDQITRASQMWGERVTTALNDGKCPRCHDTLDPNVTAGSRATSCRCIPICPKCGADEGNQVILGKPISVIWQWPISKGWRTRRHNQVMGAATVTEATFTGDGHMLTDEGVSRIDFTPTTGGWAQYGHDDEDSDQQAV